jgi:hypothetical protein
MGNKKRKLEKITSFENVRLELDPFISSRGIEEDLRRILLIGEKGKVLVQSDTTLEKIGKEYIAWPNKEKEVRWENLSHLDEYLIGCIQTKKMNSYVKPLALNCSSFIIVPKKGYFPFALRSSYDGGGDLYTKYSCWGKIKEFKHLDKFDLELIEIINKQHSKSYVDKKGDLTNKRK